MKVLVYVDAENLSPVEVTSTLQDLKSSLSSEEVLVGKFYGALKSITGVMSVCYREGLEFVETSSINKGSKNVTDMKLVLDCIWDVLEDQCSVRRVVVLTKDCDFVPLVFKLIRCGVQVELPLFDPEARCYTIADVSNALKECGYCPVATGSEALGNQFGVIRSLLNSQFSDELIEAYLNRKKNNFLKVMKPLLEPSVYEAAKIENGKEFSFYSIADGVEAGVLERVIDCYTSKFYGCSFEQKKLTAVSIEVRNKSRNAFDSF